ncbi:hypothetical protein LCGC14_0524310 [marine sediment metagenome]|uniref:Uncharacterized protein n=1 Tax=marine sediment metagenome TaxID=412755 RepID=A0A0F9RXL9_9ZZZZ
MEIIDLSDKNNEELTKKVKLNNKKIKDLITDIQNLKKDLNKLKISQGSKYPSDFVIEGKEQWEQVEKALIQQGILLEYDIIKKLDNESIIHNSNDSFIYPNGKNKFYIDYFFSKNNPHPHYNFPESKEIQTGEFETDITIDEIDRFEDQNFIFTLNTHFLIECKSRSNPPVNYIIILDKIANQMENKIKFLLSIKGSKFASDFILKTNTLWSTRHKPLPISYSNLKIDDKNTLVEAFWQLFRRIDFQSNYLLFFKFFMDDYMETKVPKNMELPNHLSTFNVFYDRWVKNGLIPSKLMEKIRINVEMFIPVIIVNGNIYSVDLDLGNYKDFIEITKKIPGFIREFSYLRQGLDREIKYVHLLRFIMQILRNNKICFKSKKLLPNFLEPILDIMVISSKDFIEVFKEMKNEIKTSFFNKIKQNSTDLYLKNKNELLKFQVFKWVLFHNPNLLEDLLLVCYRNYNPDIEELF